MITATNHSGAVAFTPAEEMSEPSLFVTLDEDYLELIDSDCTCFRVIPSPACGEADLKLVIDIYRADNPVHPEGHIGGWVCPLDRPGPVDVLVRREAGRIEVEFPGRDLSEWWVNAGIDHSAAPVLLVHAVLRQADDNAMVFLDTVRLYQHGPTSAEVNRRRCELLRPSPALAELAVPWFCWPADSRILIVTGHLYADSAVGNFALNICRWLQTHGIPCELYAEFFEPTLRGAIRPIRGILNRATSRDLVLFQYSVYDPHLEAVAALPCRKLFFFQNVTPARFFQVYDAKLAAESCGQARTQLQNLPAFHVRLANSRRSADDLRKLIESGEGTQKVERPIQVCPPMLGVRRWDFIAAEPVDLPPAPTRLLYVGRLAPNKRIEDLIALYGEYLQLEPKASLVLAGEPSPDSYGRYLRHLSRQRLPNAGNGVHFLGKVTDGQLKTIYCESSALVLMSEHEGFCIPPVEAMAFDLPVFAYADPAVRETLGGAGLIFYQKDYRHLAQTVHAVLNDSGRRERILAGQRRRLAEVEARCDGRRLLEAIEEAMFPGARAV